jgi:hypothetical protein
MCSVQYRRVKPKGAPGLAFETWDSSNQFPLETPTLLSVIPSVCDFLSSVVVCGRKLPRASANNIAEVLRLRAIKPSVCERLAKRFAQDDGLSGGLKYSLLDMQKTRKDRKSHRLRAKPRDLQFFHSTNLNQGTPVPFVIPSVAQWRDLQSLVIPRLAMVMLCSRPTIPLLPNLWTCPHGRMCKHSESCICLSLPAR